MLRYALVILAALSIASPALAWPSQAKRDANSQAAIDKNRATPTGPNFSQQTKDRITGNLLSQCPNCN